MSNQKIQTLSRGVTLRPFAEASIKASARRVVEAILDTSTYPEWNSFVPTVDITQQPDGQNSPRLVKGTHITLHVRLTSKIHTTSGEIVDTVEQPEAGVKVGDIFRINWTFDNAWHTPKFMLRATRFNEIEVLEDDQCQYRTWSEFGGVAARIVKWLFGDTLQKRFEDWARDLKEYVET